MKNAVPSRHGRLLALCGLSAALHLVLLHLVARHGAGAPAPPPRTASTLVLRLAPAVSSPAAAGATMGGADANQLAAAPVPEMARPSRHQTAQPLADPPAASARPDAAPSPTALAAPAPAAGMPTAPEPGGNIVVDSHADMPPSLRYRVRMPPPSRLEYALTRRDADGRVGAPGHAVLDWRTDGMRYALTMDGVLGRLASSGSDGDDGLEPAQATETTEQSQRAARFDAAAQRIVFADGSTAAAMPGTQDRASLLMQLTGMGLARPDQLQGSLVLHVAGRDGVAIERFQVVGDEELDTGLGRLRTRHLVQVTSPGAAQLEVWLAPDEGWLPVQLRLSVPGAGSMTQVVARRGEPAAL